MVKMHLVNGAVLVAATTVLGAGATDTHQWIGGLVGLVAGGGAWMTGFLYGTARTDDEYGKLLSEMVED